MHYDDVYMLAQYQPNITSRSEVKMHPSIFYVAPMPSVVGDCFCQASAREEVLDVCLHRFGGIDQQIQIAKTNPNNNFIGSVGLRDFEGIEKLINAGITRICVDVANGYLKTVVLFAQEVAFKFGNKLQELIVGNIHTGEALRYYEKTMDNLKLLSFRVGIGGGSACTTTKEATGFGRGPLTEISEVFGQVKDKGYGNVKIIADGGIRHAADASKAFGVGADAVMMGGYFAQATEAENKVLGLNIHWGCASYFNQNKFGDKRTQCEGTTQRVTHHKPLSELTQSLVQGIRSAVSYSGYSSLEEFIGNAVIEIKKG